MKVPNVDMPRNTYLLISQHKPGTVKNALIESFCVHARLLIDFFQNKQGVPAKTFTGARISLSRLAQISKATQAKLNTQIAHLTFQRARDPAKKIGTAEMKELVAALLLETENFLNKLAAPFTRPSIDTSVPNTQSAAMGWTGPSSATNAVSALRDPESKST
jgi:hypothetical protein